MAVFIFTPDELSELACSMLRHFQDYVFSYENQILTHLENSISFEKENETNKLVKNFGLFFEDLSLSNQMVMLRNSTDYNAQRQITRVSINMFSEQCHLTKLEIYQKLKLVRLLSHEFLSKQNTERCTGYIEMVADKIIRETASH